MSLSKPKNAFLKCRCYYFFWLWVFLEVFLEVALKSPVKQKTKTKSKSCELLWHDEIVENDYVIIENDNDIIDRAVEPNAHKGAHLTH